jgi:hypothetical protein
MLSLQKEHKQRVYWRVYIFVFVWERVCCLVGVPVRATGALCQHELLLRKALEVFGFDT